jgi:hypothetical protein
MKLNARPNFKRYQHNRILRGSTIFQGATTVETPAKKYKIKQRYSNILDLYSLIKLKPYLQKIVDDFANKHDLKNCVGVHIRRTDLIPMAMDRKWQWSSDREFYLKITNELKKNPNQKFFLATDNLGTQRHFTKHFPDKFTFYREIPYIKDKRKTSLEHAIIDIFLLSKCKRIHGSKCSSFSTMAKRLLDIRVRKENETVKAKDVQDSSPPNSKERAQPCQESDEHSKTVLSETVDKSSDPSQFSLPEKSNLVSDPSPSNVSESDVCKPVDKEDTSRSSSSIVKAVQTSGPTPCDVIESLSLPPNLMKK